MNECIWKDCMCGSKLFLVKVAKKDGHGIVTCRKCGHTQRVAVSVVLGRHRPEKSHRGMSYRAEK